MIFLPGIMWALADRRGGFEKNPPTIILVLKIFMFGSFTYGLLITLSFFGWLPDISEFVKEAVLILTEDSKDVPKEYELLVFSIPTSAILTLIWLYLVNIKAFSWLLFKIGVIKSAHQFSLIYAALDCSPNIILMIRIRDFESGRSYKGELDSFDESQGAIKLILNDVEICNIDGNILGKAEQYVYSRSTQNFEFEIITRKERNK